MTQFEIKSTPENARRLVWLSEVCGVEIDDAIRELAISGVHNFDQFRLDPWKSDLAQDLLDMNLRAGVVFPEGSGTVAVLKGILEVISAVAVRKGIRTIVLADIVKPSSGIGMTMANRSLIDITHNQIENGLRGDFEVVREGDKRGSLYNERDKTLVIYLRHTLLVQPNTLIEEFEHSIVLASHSILASMQMYPALPTLGSVIGGNTTYLRSRNLNGGVKKIGKLFNITYAANTANRALEEDI